MIHSIMAKRMCGTALEVSYMAMAVIITLKKMLREHDGEREERERGERERERASRKYCPAAGERYDNLRPPLSENELLYFIKGAPLLYIGKFLVAPISNKLQ